MTNRDILRLANYCFMNCNVLTRNQIEAFYNAALEEGRQAALKIDQKPVAWICRDCGELWKVSNCGRSGGHVVLPLYTTPQVRPMTDEEILLLWSRAKNEIDFARAVLKEASK